MKLAKLVGKLNLVEQEVKRESKRLSQLEKDVRKSEKALEKLKKKKKELSFTVEETKYKDKKNIDNKSWNNAMSWMRDQYWDHTLIRGMKYNEDEKKYEYVYYEGFGRSKPTVAVGLVHSSSPDERYYNAQDPGRLLSVLGLQDRYRSKFLKMHPGKDDLNQPHVDPDDEDSIEEYMEQYSETLYDSIKYLLERSGWFLLPRF